MYLMTFFFNARFFTTVNDLNALPSSQSEIAFVGRSNAGKSSAINALTQQTRLAYVSKTPGRTQHINFFELSEGFFLVDLPGYGFAKAHKSVRDHWVGLLGQYLQKRDSLLGLVLIMDIRHPLKLLDIQMLNFFILREKPVHILLSKADKLPRQKQNQALNFVRHELDSLYHNSDITVQVFSSLKRQGLEEVEEVIKTW